MKHSLKFAGVALLTFSLAVSISHSGEKAPIEAALGEAAPADADKAPTPLLVMQLASTDTSLRVKEPAQVKVTLTNNGKKPVTLVLPGDGSESGWRTPVVSWSVLDVGDKAKHPAEPVPQRVPRCGNMNPLQADEVFDLAPGASKELTGWIYLEAFARPGQYRVVFLYANRPALTWKGAALGHDDPAAMKRVRNSTPCSLVSNEVVFTVEEGKIEERKE